MDSGCLIIHFTLMNCSDTSKSFIFEELRSEVSRHIVEDILHDINEKNAFIPDAVFPTKSHATMWYNEKFICRFFISKFKKIEIVYPFNYTAITYSISNKGE